MAIASRAARDIEIRIMAVNGPIAALFLSGAACSAVATQKVASILLRIAMTSRRLHAADNRNSACYLGARFRPRLCRPAHGW